MSTDQKITLFDLPSREPVHAWSLNPWKTRMILNYKGLDYKTQWTEYPDIKPTLKDHVEPNADGQYTIPTIRLPDDTWVMDSFKIADVLESRYPTPSLHLDSPVCKKVKHIVARAMPAFYRNFMPLVPERLLTQRSQDYWYATRKQILDMGPDPEAWRKAGPVLQEATALLKETEGPFFLGKDFSFADVIWISLLIFWKRIGDDVFEKFLEAAGDKDLHLAMMEAAKEWTARDGKGE